MNTGNDTNTDVKAVIICLAQKVSELANKPAFAAVLQRYVTESERPSVLDGTGMPQPIQRSSRRCDRRVRYR
jgi:hypothetical protein